MLRTKLARAWAVVLPVCLVVYLIVPPFGDRPDMIEIAYTVVWMMLAIMCAVVVAMLLAVPVAKVLGRVFNWIDKGE